MVKAKSKTLYKQWVFKMVRDEFGTFLIRLCLVNKKFWGKMQGKENKEKNKIVLNLTCYFIYYVKLVLFISI